MSAFDDTVLKVAAKRLRILQNGKPREITHAEALIQKEHESGLKGVAYAQNNALQRIEKAQLKKEARIKEECELWQRVKTRAVAELADARARGRGFAYPLPHPDDIVIDWREGVRIVGPMNEADLATYAQSLNMRDALFLQDRIEGSSGGADAGASDAPSSPLILAVLINRYLPPSLRLTHAQLIGRIDAARCLSKRDALKACRTAWRAAGTDMRRGTGMVKPVMLLPILQTWTWPMRP